MGLAGVVGYSVSRRIREIGIRKALGARDDEVVRRVVRRGMALVLLGGAVGAVVAAMGARVLSGVLFVGVFDVPSFLAGFAVLAAVAALANWIPARRAMRVDPVDLLRSE